MKRFWLVRCRAVAVAVWCSGWLHAQEAPPAPGTVLFSGQQTHPQAAGGQETISPDVSEAEREALLVTASDLDVHLRPATGEMTARVQMTVKNRGTEPLGRLVLQVSSSLRWENFATVAADGTLQTLPLARETVETDADHTGFVSEAVLTLPQPLAPGGTYQLVGVYCGRIVHSSTRLDRIGAPADQARLADWDEIGPEGTALRGFGEVLWYPVAAAPVLLGDGARFFQAVGAERANARQTLISLRLTVEYVGEAPHSAYFCGRQERMTAHSENQDVPVAEAPGIATAEFAAQALGFRTPSLFVTMKPETTSADGLLTAVTDDDAGFKDYEAAAEMVRPLLAGWFGSEGPARPLHLIDHRGQTFEDGALLVTSMTAAEPATLAPRMAEGLSRAWLPARTAWIEEGLARFCYLLWTEQTAGRGTALAQMQQDAVPLALAEPGVGTGQTLVEARDEIYFRTKAAAVFWMLRGIVGDDTLKSALARLRPELRASEPASVDETGLLQRTLEQRGGIKLDWFFDDWVYADKGLPDLTIVQVTPRQLPTTGGKAAGWLLAVEVRNDGDAIAEVPVTVRSGTLTATEKLRIAAHTSASTRILFEKSPEEVQVNDGGVPEARTSVHTQRVTALAH